jgi:hypothetical protein
MLRLRRNKGLARADKISQRLPHFYSVWASESQLSLLISAVGKRMDEAEKDLVSVLHSHWVDKATGQDLDGLGALLNTKRNEKESDSNYRNRIKIAIIKYTGGGTVEAIKQAVRIALKLSQDQPVVIIENPKAGYSASRTYEVKDGKCSISPNEDQLMSSMSVEALWLYISIIVETKDAKIKDPTLTNLETGLSIAYKGEVSYGDILVISKKGAFLNKEDRTKSLTGEPTLPRKGARWQFKEYFGEHLGIFDKSCFDDSYFQFDAKSSITFKWMARSPAAFEVRVPKESLENARISKEEMRGILNAVKAGGVKAELAVI